MKRIVIEIVLFVHYRLSGGWEKSFQISCKICLLMIKLYGEYTEEVLENGKGV